MTLNVLSIAYPFAPVRPDTAGGAEQVLAMLDRALIHDGHNSIVIAAKGSHIAGTLLDIPAVKDTIDDDVRDRQYARVIARIAGALETFPIDLVHMHGIDFSKYIPSAHLPVLVTLHLPVSWYSKHDLLSSRPDTFFNCVSRSQFNTAPQSESILGFIENGIDLPRLDMTTQRGQYALALGRICPEKGFHIALDAARLAGLGLIVAGQLYRYPAYERYFIEQFSPRLDGHKYKFVGAVNPSKKYELLSNARCLLAPSLAAETSSLAAMEALACGTPVIAFSSGALPEIVEHRKTGFLVSSPEEMAVAINSCGSIDPEYCRQTALRRFDSGRMAAEYLSLYNRILEMASSHAASATD